MNNRVVIGMSGGVDSSVGAAMLQRQGYEVIGVTMKLWEGEHNDGCCSLSVIDDAKAVADRLGIEHHVVDFRDEFKSYVTSYFVDEYMSGRTPNPCVLCNKHIKFNALLKVADELGASFIATGHYAKVVQQDGRFLLVRPKDAKKDQTYFLYNMTQSTLGRTLFPLYDVTKAQAREIAAEIGLSVSEKPDSQDICFVPDGDYARFLLTQGAKSCEGNFVDTNGDVLGKHKGIIHYTVGQRKGLGIAFNKPMYVTQINSLTNEVVLDDGASRYKTGLVAKDINLISMEKIDKEFRCTAKIRYNAPDVACTVSPLDNGFKVDFDEPQMAVTPGQMVVLYDQNIVIGGGIISV